MSGAAKQQILEDSHLKFGSMERALDSATGRALAILSAVSAMSGSVSATELAPSLGLPKPTVHRLMLLLERTGHLQRAAGSKRFIVGRAQMEMALQTVTNAAQFSARRLILSNAADEIGGSCHLGTLAGDLIVLVDSVDAGDAGHANGLSGSRSPLYCTASGKLFLSRMPANKRRRLLTASPLEKFTPRTVVDPPVIENELRGIRTSQVGLEDREFLEGFVCVAVPVFDKKGRICATISTHATTESRNLSDIVKLVPALHQASSAITRTLAA
jgi:IclR family acetate operon transcriptional repressor